ncbi:hypothetical protein IRL76_03910 [Qipengyuania soli]|uniref:TolB N-terminal domain-containing protein n=2 Tax=Qipengyuania soli TaxID=2782568 RepID=A0A7S8F759_9SPHN|nr:hypothetical protein IRL76_03910 [Qipengyuania soli]
MIEPCDRPIMFELTHTAELSHWLGDLFDPAWRVFLGDVRTCVGLSQSPLTKASARDPLPPIDQLAVAVLPFVNMSSDPEQEHFSDGITEDIITDLSRVSELRVIPRSSVFTFKGKNVDTAVIARQLNVTHLLEGSVRRSGNRVRLTAQLIDAATSNHVWAQRYDRELSDIFDLQDELSTAIIEALKLRLVPTAPGTCALPGTRNLEAYDLFNRARALAGTMEIARLFSAPDLYRQCLAIDPDFGQAWVDYGLTLFTVLTYMPKNLFDSWEDLDLACKRSIELAPDNNTSLSLTAYKAQWEYDWPAAAAAISRIETIPDWSTGLLSVQWGLGYLADGIETCLAWCKSEPMILQSSLSLQMAFDLAHRPEEAAREYIRSKSLLGSRSATDLFAMYRAMVAGDHDAARGHLQAIVDQGEFPGVFWQDVLDRFDDPPNALQYLRGDFSNPEADHTLRMLLIAEFAAYFGDEDLAFAALRKGLVEQRHGFGVIHLWFPIYRELRKSPRFKQILVDIGLVDFWRKSGRWGDFVRPLGDDDFELIG